MAGLVAAARARELGAEPVVLEKGDRPGGSMLLSSGVIWRYRRLRSSRRSARAATRPCRRVIVERLDEALEWLESLGAPSRRARDGQPDGRSACGSTRGGLTGTLVRDIVDDFGRLSWRDRTRPKGRSSLPQADFPCGWLGSADCSCGRTAGARATGSTSRSRAARRPPATWTSSTGGRCPRPSRRRRARLRAPRAAVWPLRARSSPRTGQQRFEGEPVAGRRPISSRRSRAGPAAAPGTAFTRTVLGERVRERTVGEMIEAARKAGAVVRDRTAFHLGARPGECHADAGRHTDRRARPRRRRRGALRGRSGRRRDLDGRLLERARGSLVFGRIAAETGAQLGVGSR